MAIDKAHDPDVTGGAATRNRTVRISDRVWLKAKQKAERAGSSISEVVRDFLADYAGEEPEKAIHGKPKPARSAWKRRDGQD